MGKRRNHIPEAFNLEEWDIAVQVQSRFWDIVRHGFSLEDEKELLVQLEYIDSCIGPCRGCKIAEEVRLQLKKDATLGWIYYREIKGQEWWIHLDPIEELIKLANNAEYRYLPWLDRYCETPQVVATHVPATRQVRFGLAAQRFAAACIVTFMFLPRWLH